jgi:AraC family transcriptional activator of mtrCDE
LDERPVLRISPGDLERLLGTLDVNFVALSECLVSRGYSLELVATNAPGIHYNIVGTGRAIVGNRDPLPLMPHTLIVVPPNSRFRIEVAGNQGFTGLLSVKAQPQTVTSGSIRRRVAGDGDPFLMLVCGYLTTRSTPN